MCTVEVQLKHLYSNFQNDSNIDFSNEMNTTLPYGISNTKLIVSRTYSLMFSAVSWLCLPEKLDQQEMFGFWDSEKINDILLDAFNDDAIDYKKKLINVGMDNSSTMQGQKSGDITRQGS